jgi:hypothetical protein
MSKAITQQVLYDALEESLKLQSHYATLLNQHDGGERMVFADVNAWIKRLRDCKKCDHTNVVRGVDVPRVYGSWRTQVCVDCGAFRTHGHNDIPEPSKPWAGHDWRPASEYVGVVTEHDSE